MFSMMGIFAYLGPETMLPVTSAVAGAIGVVMLLGRGSLRWVRDKARSVGSKLKPGSQPKARPRRIGQGPSSPIPSKAKDRIPS